MHVDTDDLATLLKMQHLDLELLRAKKKLEELPQRAVILQARSKKKAVEQKRAQLDELRAKADAQLARIDDEDASLIEKQRRVQEEIDVQAQVAAMMADLERQEAEATKTFVQEGGALKDQAARLEAERAMLASSLPQDLLDRYEKTAARTGGVAVGRLQGANCGVCRMAIEGGRLIDMKAQGNVAACPQCGRLLILE